ncbi:MAG: hypothetical protein ACTTKL_11050 [Treponema sp.]
MKDGVELPPARVLLMQNSQETAYAGTLFRRWKMRFIHHEQRQAFSLLPEDAPSMR